MSQMDRRGFPIFLGPFLRKESTLCQRLGLPKFKQRSRRSKETKQRSKEEKEEDDDGAEGDDADAHVGRGSPILYIYTPDRPPPRLLLV